MICPSLRGVIHELLEQKNRQTNSYTMGCLPVRGDNPRALASG